MNINKLQNYLMSNKAKLLFYGLLISFSLVQGQEEAPSWVDFAQKSENNQLNQAVLNDYSYTGYHFSEKEIPDVSTWNTISVLDYGAVVNDNDYDDTAIVAAIAAAEASTVPTVVYFPAGRYKVSSTQTENSPIFIRGSHIVLKGAGSGVEGTEIFVDKRGNHPYRFEFKPASTPNTKITNTAAKRILKGDFEIEVVSTSGLIVGQTVELYHQGGQNLEANMPGLTYNSIWNVAKNNRGIRTLEKHIITKIEGNKVTFKNPVQYTITAEFTGAQLNLYETIEEVGVEDILFTSDWLNYPEDYKHHANDIVDYGWRALKLTNVKNSWVRNCEFKDWNEMLQISTSIGVTVKDIVCSGKKGHTSYYAIYSYGVLFENCRDIVDQGLSRDNVKGMGHGPGMRWSTTSTVFSNCQMQFDQSIDCHGYHPYGNLLENVYGGCFRANGGAHNSYPNSGPYLTFWNFVHDSRYNSVTFNFWDPVNRRTHTYGYPNFVGFTAPHPNENVTLQNTGINELQGQQAYPKSLFDAQLQLRLYGAYMSASSSKPDFMAKLANDSKEITYWESETSGIGNWIMLDLGSTQDVNSVLLNEVSNRIGDWKLEYWNGTTWEDLTVGSEIGSDKTINFNLVNTRKIRFNILSMLSGQESTSAALRTFQLGSTLSNDNIDNLNRIIKAYPNPNNGNFELSFPFALKNVQLEIYNIHSQLLLSKVYSVSANKIEVDIADKPSGIYFVKLNLDHPMYIKIVKK